MTEIGSSKRKIDEEEMTRIGSSKRKIDEEEMTRIGSSKRKIKIEEVNEKFTKEDEAKLEKLTTERLTSQGKDPDSAEKYNFCDRNLYPEEYRLRVKKYTYLRKVPLTEWSDSDLLYRMDLYRCGRISKEVCLKEMPVVKKYYAQRWESEGFDIDVCPRFACVPGQICPLRISQKQLHLRFKDLAELAIQSFNNDYKNTDYKVVQVEKVNEYRNSWCTFYITFTAKDISPRGRYRSPKTFQARVTEFPYGNEEVMVELCRIKPKK